MIKEKTINPYEILQARRVVSAPPHFEYIDIPLRYNLQESLDKWIQKACKKRYYIGMKLNINSKTVARTKTTDITIGFEDSKELSYFMLACPHLKYN